MRSGMAELVRPWCRGWGADAILSPDEGEKRPQRGPVENAISLRGTREWRDWLNRLAKHCRADGSTVIDQTLARHAREVGFHDPPSRR